MIEPTPPTAVIVVGSANLDYIVGVSAPLDRERRS